MKYQRNPGKSLEQTYRWLWFLALWSRQARGHWFQNCCWELKMQFSRHGIPEINSCELKKIADEWNFRHITPWPRNPQSNENAVEICESIMKMATRGKFDPYLSLLDYRNTPSDVSSSLTQRSYTAKLQQKNAQPATADTQAAWTCDSVPAKRTTKADCLQTKAGVLLQLQRESTAWTTARSNF